MSDHPAPTRAITRQATSAVTHVAPDGGLITYGMKHNEALVMVLLRGPPPRPLFRA